MFPGKGHQGFSPQYTLTNWFPTLQEVKDQDVVKQTFLPKVNENLVPMK